jgi:hypothetical protein
MTEKQIAMVLVEVYKKWELTYNDDWLEIVTELRRMLNDKEYTEAKEYE